MRVHLGWMGLCAFGSLAVASAGACTVSEKPVTVVSSATSTGVGAAGGAGGMGGGTAGSGNYLAGEDCDPMVPTQCGFPFPSDVWLADDPTTVTGKRVALGATTMPLQVGTQQHVPPELLASLDGWSIGQAPMTHLPGATVTGLPPIDDIDASLAASSPTILIEADTGLPVPHFAELDQRGDNDDDRAFMLRPVVRLKDATRYIVAIRNVVDDNGVPLAPSDVFAALRDGADSDDPTVDARRDLYADIFQRLENAGYETSDLQIAWDFTTANLENKTSWMLHMRDEALATVGEDGPTYTIEEIVEDPNPNIRRRIKGLMEVPLYLTTAEPGGRLNFGDDGLPEQNGTAQFRFHVNIPHAATMGTPGALLQNGHGLLGRLEEGQNGYQAQIANTHNFVMFAVDFIGFAEDDEQTVIDAIIQDFNLFGNVIERQHQGMLNSLLAMRMMKGRFVDEPAVQFNGMSAIDPMQAFYRGDSQGGIYGVTYMALTTDVPRGLLGEPGGPYNFLLHRSRDFDPFLGLLRGFFTSDRNVQLVIAAAQMLWDRTDPITYVNHVTANPLPGTPSHNVLLHVAIGDQQVTPYGAHLLARELGATNVAPVNREVWNLPSLLPPIAGNAMVEFEFDGVPEVPKTNVPPMQPTSNDPHDWVRVLDASIDQTNTFLRTGIVEAFCDGACDPE